MIAIKISSRDLISYVRLKSDAIIARTFIEKDASAVIGRVAVEFMDA